MLYNYRWLDLCLSIPMVILLLPIMFVIFFINYFFTSGSPIFLQKRLGKDQKLFTLIKFRTMKKGTQSVATHLAEVDSVTKFGRVLRKTKLDELPQLINVISGQMSLVGPRPNLSNQAHLIKARNVNGVYNVLPGVTGLAQINNIDMSNPEALAKIDAQMIANMSITNYFRYIFLTVIGKGGGDAIKGIS